MGAGWRIAFCTAAPRDSTDRDTRDTIPNQENYEAIRQSPTPSPRSCAKLRFFSGNNNDDNNNPVTHRLSALSPRCASGGEEGLQQEPPPVSSSNDTIPRLQCKINEQTKPTPGSHPATPRSPFSILKNTLRLSRNVECGVCSQSVKPGQGTAIYTAECSHAFHFPCIAAHVRKRGSLDCPVCNLTWKDAPLLSAHKNSSPTPNSPVLEKNTSTGDNALFPPKEFSKIQIHSNDKNLTLAKPKPYNDDEPLFSPKCGTPRFCSIPEEAEEEPEHEEENDDDFEEFQGFFAKPTPMTRKKIDDQKSVRNVEVKLLPEAAIISVGRTQETFVVALKVKTPSPPTDNGITMPLLSPTLRAPIDLVTVLDISGTMSGEKLHMLKHAMRLIISSLGSADRLSIVAFSATSQRLLPLRRMTAHGQRIARRIVDRLICGQGKCVPDALMKSSKVLEDRREKNPVAGIVLLSDGHDEKQLKDSYQRIPFCHDTSVRFAHIEIPVRFGLEEAEKALSRQISGVLSVVAQEVRIQLGLASGSAPAEIIAVYGTHHGRWPMLMNSDSARVGDMCGDEERELLIVMRAPTSAIGSHHVMSVRCSYRDPTSQELICCRERALLVPRPRTVRSNDSRLERMRQQFLSTRALAESRCLVEHGELASAQHLLSSARALLNGSDEFVKRVEAAEAELKWKRGHKRKDEALKQAPRRKVEVVGFVDENGEPLTPTSAWRAAERLAKVAIMRKSMNKVSDLHGFENARF
ncbi:E3 ubiquitin-protein ligase WAV3-like protein [Drosera capensis]